MNTYNDLINDLEPASSERDVVTAIIDKNRMLKRKKVRSIYVSVIVIAILTTMTITVGAVNDWNYTNLLQNVFDNNQIVAESIENETNYRVVNNTYDGITFELAALYTDIESLFLIVDIISEKPVFNESDTVAGSLLSTLVLISDSPGRPDFTVPDFMVNDFSFYLIDETRMIAVFFFAEPLSDDVLFANQVSHVSSFREAVEAGREFALLFGHTNFSGHSGLPLKGGGAEVRFIIDSMDGHNVILMNPDLQLESDLILKEIRITPFSIVIRFDGVVEKLDKDIFYYDNGWKTDISILMDNGEIKALDMLDNNGGWLRSMSSGFLADYENHSFFATFNHDRLLALDNVAAIIFKGVEIPVTR